jgi:hypothetical protein
MSNKINFILRKLFKTSSGREIFIKNKNNYNKFLIKNNQQNYNKIITRKNHTFSSSQFGGGGGPRGNKPNIFELICGLSAIGIYNSISNKEKKN